MGGNNEFFERNKYLKILPSMQRVQLPQHDMTTLIPVNKP